MCCLAKVLLPNIRLLSGRISFVQDDFSKKAYLSFKKKLTQSAVKIHFNKLIKNFLLKSLTNSCVCFFFLVIESFIQIVKSHVFKTVLYHKASLTFQTHFQVTKFQITSEKSVFFSIIQVSGFRFIVVDNGWSKWKCPFKFRTVHI